LVLKKVDSEANQKPKFMKDDDAFFQENVPSPLPLQIRTPVS